MFHRLLDRTEELKRLKDVALIRFRDLVALLGSDPTSPAVRRVGALRLFCLCLFSTNLASFGHSAARDPPEPDSRSIYQHAPPGESLPPTPGTL